MGHPFHKTCVINKELLNRMCESKDHHVFGHITFPELRVEATILNMCLILNTNTCEQTKMSLYQSYHAQGEGFLYIFANLSLHQNLHISAY